MAQAADKTTPTYPLYLALIQVKLEQIPEAKKNLLLAATLDPDQAVAWGTLADLWLRESSVDLCLQHIARARELQPEYTPWRLIEARALKRKGDARAALELLVPLDPSERRQEHVLRLIGECYGMLKRPADAAAAYADAATADPTNGGLAYETALWFERAGDTTHALEWADRARMLGHAEAAELVTKLSHP
jgi:tetratricopeptide (TPR) repeat protein